MCGRGSVGLSHVVLGDYIINMFNDEIIWEGVVYQLPLYQLYLGGRGTVCLSDSDYIIHTLKMRIIRFCAS